MSVAPAQPDLSAVKARQRKTWSSGDYAIVGSRIVLISELLAEAADLRAGWDVLDVVCGAGNAALAAARRGARVVGIDYVDGLLAKARTRAAADGLDVEFRLGDAEDLPAADSSFDAVLSAVGAMFAPDHQRVADEIVRVTRPGGTVALASWTPDGFIGEMFQVITGHVPGPAGVPSPMLWGTTRHLRGLFGDALAEARFTERTFTFRFASAEEFVAFFRRWYGPTLKAFEALDETGRTELAAGLTDLVRRHDRLGDGNGVVVPSTYLEAVLTLR